jgi:hypothetical protein
MNWMSAQLEADKAVVVGGRYSLGNMLAIQADNWRRGQHVSTVDHVLKDAAGTPTGMVLRNPYGTQGPGGDRYITLTDFTRIYFCIGRAIRADTV